MDDEAIREIFEPFGAVTIRRMFGGKGVYVDSVIVALEVDGELKLKADAQSSSIFDDAGAVQWRYEGSKAGKPVAMPYWGVPDAALDDPDEMGRYARLALEAGMRAAAGKGVPLKRRAMDR